MVVVATVVPVLILIQQRIKWGIVKEGQFPAHMLVTCMWESPRAVVCERVSELIASTQNMHTPETILATIPLGLQLSRVYFSGHRTEQVSVGISASGADLGVQHRCRILPLLLRPK